MSQPNTLVGGWTTYRAELSEEETKVFNEAFKGFVGVQYNPVAVASQVVAGVNYRYFCNARAVIPDPQNQAAIVSIYKPLNDTAVIKNIKEIKV